jgi:Fe2+ transport system protein B
MNSLFARKLLVAFLVAFGAVFIPAVLDILDKLHQGVDANFSTELVWSVIAGGVGAGIRAILALLPGLNLVPSDAQHSIGGK